MNRVAVEQIDGRMNAIVAPPATGILDPRSGRPVGADDSFYVGLNNQLADKGFLVTTKTPIGICERVDADILARGP